MNLLKQASAIYMMVVAAAVVAVFFVINSFLEDSIDVVTTVWQVYWTF